MRKKLNFSLSMALSAGLMACAPANDKTATSERLRALTPAEKVSALRVQLPISSVQKALLLIADPEVQLGAIQAEVTDLASEIKDTCDVVTLTDDELPEDASPNKRKTVRVEIKASSEHPNCGLNAVIVKKLARRINGKIAQPQEKGNVTLTVREARLHPLLQLFKVLDYSYELKNTEKSANGKTVNQILRGSNGYITTLTTPTQFSLVDTVDIANDDDQLTEDQNTRITLKFADYSAAWERRSIYINGIVTSESNKFNGVEVKNDEFERLRSEAIK